MKIRKLNPDIIKKTDIFEYYIGNYKNEEAIFLNEYYEVDLSKENLFFPIYIRDNNEVTRKEKYIPAFLSMRDNYLKLGRDILLDRNFWYSLFLDKLKDRLIEEYPNSLNSEKEFRNIILKDFNWENYVYKFIFGAEYIQEMISNKEDHIIYFKLITENLDIYNYILKSKIFKNSNFLIKFLDVIVETNSSEILKKKIDLSNNKDERVGRRVISEFVKIYPAVFVHVLDKEDFKNYFIKYLSHYSKFIK
ncbi:MAG: hypothetical protein ACRC6U_06850 [Fusobacteriaceae bacterium]